MGGSSFKVQSHGPFYVKQFVLFFLLFQLTLRFWDKHSLYFPQKVAILRTRVHPSLYSTFTGLEGALLGNVFFGRFPLWLRRIKRLLVGNFYKVNRCLARYSPRATTTSQPINRAPNEQAMVRNANFGLNLVVFEQKNLFQLEKSKVLLPT